MVYSTVFVKNLVMYRQIMCACAMTHTVFDPKVNCAMDGT